MKLIYYLISLSFCLLAVTHSALLDDLHESLLAYLKSQDYQTEYNPLAKSHYLDQDPHGNGKQPLDEDPHRTDKKKNLDPHKKIVRNWNKKPRSGLNPWVKIKNVDQASQMKKNEEWGKKYQFYNDEVNPKQALEEEGGRYNQNKELHTDIAKAKIKTQLLHKYRKKHLAKEIPIISPFVKSKLKAAQMVFRKDPVLNSLRKQQNTTKIVNYRRNQYDASKNSLSSSSSLELRKSNEEFHVIWEQKKRDALNNSHLNRGDKVNMVAARPSGVPCGDPNQHDMPWGICMVAAECDVDYRIPRGDLFCGRTQFICCGYQILTYDTNQAFDISPEDNKSKSTDSEEKRAALRTSKEIRQRRKRRDKRKRRQARERRKKQIKKQIRAIAREIKKVLKNQHSNRTQKSKTRTKQLKKFIIDLKKQYKKDRKLVQELHDSDVTHLDKGLMEKLKQMEAVHSQFAKNATFGDVLLKRTITKKTARMLLEAYPELEQFLDARRLGGDTRRSGGGLAAGENETEDKVLQYDVEYGYLYY